MKNMEKMLTCLVVAVSIASVLGDIADVKMFCEVILGQSPNDTNYCLSAPDNYENEKGEQVALIYVCCVGYFGHTTILYVNGLDGGLLELMAKTTSSKEFIRMGKFIKDRYREGYKLTVDDYNAWSEPATA